MRAGVSEPVGRVHGVMAQQSRAALPGRQAALKQSRGWAKKTLARCANIRAEPVALADIVSLLEQLEGEPVDALVGNIAGEPFTAEAGLAVKDKISFAETVEVKA